VVKTLQAIEQCNVAILLLDGAEEIADQDAHIAGFILEAGRALVVVVNKWDGLGDYQRASIKRDLNRKFHFSRLGAATLHLGALGHRRAGGPALSASGVSRRVHKAADAPPDAGIACGGRAPTATARGPVAAEDAVRTPGRAEPAGDRHPWNALARVQASYRRYLEGWFRDHFSLQGTPLRIEFRSAANPYVT